MSDDQKTEVAVERKNFITNPNNKVHSTDFGDFGPESVLAFGLYIRSKEFDDAVSEEIKCPNPAEVSAFRAEAEAIINAHVSLKFDQEFSKRISDAEVEASEEMKKIGLSAIPRRVDDIIKDNLHNIIKPLEDEVKRSGSFQRSLIIALFSSAFIAVLTLLIAYLVYISPFNPLP